MNKGRMFTVIAFLTTFGISKAQEVDRTFATNQCSAIREVIFSAHQKQFANLLDKELKGSHGYQVQGTWRFETFQYASLLDWPGASKTYIDDSRESTDSSSKIIRQFVAEFGQLKNRDEARQKFDYLNAQIIECRLLLSDTNITVLKPLPLEKIKDELPVAALDAKLYPVTIKQSSEAEPGQEVVIMTAWERNGQYYTAYMIVEYRLQQTEIPQAEMPSR
jgi:hypothetical protein